MKNNTSKLRNKSYGNIFVSLLVLFCLGTTTNPSLSLAEEYEDRFSGYEIRVIRPKFFQKTERFELGAGLMSILNNSFVYTFLASGLMTYHFSESIGLELTAAYGTSLDKSDKDTLKDDYKIKTEVFRVQYLAEAALIWTPMYGKVQLPKGRFIYFDTYLSLGGGLTGVDWRYSDMCVQQEGDTATVAPPSDTTISYPTILLGIGQRIFRTKETAVRWDLRSHSTSYNTADGTCSPDDSGDSTLRTSISLQIGASKFF